ncbi:hypothetical protein H310_14329 [Aphanomyces invadans]|uniref:HECT-type E3 ubiquitin transferase n=2 Tax=Aphanomyces invadans TaxID=157072 RepID=A0A024TA31_9STRA|nr:hypothetical protein H310_14329 [Aphanomyces invadans]ETV90995.1 hypothetical protein H310_14329 [Aphanomyces invadans]|eukprot:XP_008880384.1 hypothetical protein H310_14329 [Aphanomyces invadans]
MDSMVHPIYPTDVQDGQTVVLPRLAIECVAAAAADMSDDEDLSEHDMMRTLRALSRQPQDLPQALRGLLGQLGGDLPMIFGANNPQFRILLEKIQPSNPAHVQMTSLSELCEILSMSSSEEMLTLSGFRADAFVPVLAELVAAPPLDSMEILLLSCRALAIVLDVCSSAIEMAVSANVVASLCDKLLNIEYMDVAELALRMLERLCSSPAGRAAALRENGLVALLQFVDFFAVDVQRTAARTAALVCTDVPSLAMVQIGGGVQLVLNLTRSFDADIVYHGFDCLNRLCHSPTVQADKDQVMAVIDTDVLDHVLSMLASYPTATATRMPENMKPTTYALLLQILAAVGRVCGRRMVDSGVVSVLCAILTRAAPQHRELVRQSLLFIDAVVVSLSAAPTNDDSDVVELATTALTTWLLPALVASLAGLADATDAASRAVRTLYVDVLNSMLTTISHRALVHVDVLCAFITAALQRPVHRRLATLRDDGGSTNDVSVALFVMSLALTHAYDVYHVRFVRDGVYCALERVANDPMATAESIGASQLLATYATTGPMTTPVLDDLAALAKDLHAAPLRLTGETIAGRLQRVFGVGSATPFELSTSLVVPALVACFESSPDASCAFRRVLACVDATKWVAALVSSLQELVVWHVNHPPSTTHESTTLSFADVVAAMSATGTSPSVFRQGGGGTSAIVAMVELLGQHLKVRLRVDHDDDANKSTGRRDTVVLVEPLARIETMEAFVAEKWTGRSQLDDDSDGLDRRRATVASEEVKTHVYTSLDGDVLAPSMTILEALLQSKRRCNKEEAWSIDALWSDAVPLTFHVTEATAAPPPRNSPPPVENYKAALSTSHPSLAASLALLELLHNVSAVPAKAFEVPALAVHIQRTCLMQPLVVALAAFPEAALAILHSYSFLLPLETKLHFLYASSFGAARAIVYLSKTLWKAEAAATGARATEATGARRQEEAALAAAVARVAKIPRLKVRVARSKLLQSAVKLMTSYGGQNAILEIEYLGEVGTGLGPTTEFYSLVSQEVQAKQLKMWRHDGDASEDADDETKRIPATMETKGEATEQPPSHHALPIRGYHRIAVIHCKACTHVTLPICPVHNVLLTQSNDGSTKPTSTTEPQCHVCAPQSAWSLQCGHCTVAAAAERGRPAPAATSGDVTWRWWIVSDSEVAYLAQAYPRGKTSVVHPVLQCSHCDTVTFPGTDAGLVTMDGDRMTARNGRRMYERDYRAVTKHASVHCEGTPLAQTTVTLLQSDVQALVALVPPSPQVLDSQVDGFDMTSSIYTELDAIVAPHGLYPRPISPTSAQVVLFDFLGKLVAQALVDERLLDLPLAVPFLRLVRGEVLHTPLSDALAHISILDPTLGRSLTYLYAHRDDPSVNDMGLTFVLPPSLPLCENGEARPVTTDNVVAYVELAAAALLHTSVQRQVDAFRAGFSSIAPLDVLTMLSADDWSAILADPSREMWPGGADEIRAAMVCDHGYTPESRAIQWLVEILAELTPDQQKLFVRFVTGSHRLPIGGLAKLDPTLTVVRKLTADDAASNDAMLPSASTCTNYLKLPDYTSKQVMRAKLLYCIEEGQLSFHLS